ncbi:AraC-like ligand-binding domain-containing protein [Actinomycetospora sp. C-140]
MLVLDSRDAPAAERAELVATLMAESSAATVTLAPHDELHARMELWQLGRLHLFRSASSGMAMSRDARRARRDEAPIVALAVQEQSTARHEQFGGRRSVPPGGLMMVDLTAPFAFSWATTVRHGPSRCPSTRSGCPSTPFVPRRPCSTRVRSPPS